MESIIIHVINRCIQNNRSSKLQVIEHINRLIAVETNMTVIPHEIMSNI